MDGYGIELWSDGEVYEGWSTQGRLNGYGRASYTSGRYLFHIRVLLQIVRAYAATGDTYIGMWKNGLRDGGTYAWRYAAVFLCDDSLIMLLPVALVQ